MLSASVTFLMAVADWRKVNSVNLSIQINAWVVIRLRHSSLSFVEKPSK